jgi:hypothetical protein
MALVLLRQGIKSTHIVRNRLVDRRLLQRLLLLLVLLVVEEHNFRAHVVESVHHGVDLQVFPIVVPRQLYQFPHVPSYGDALAHLPALVLQDGNLPKRSGCNSTVITNSLRIRCSDFL